MSHSLQVWLVGTFLQILYLVGVLGFHQIQLLFFYAFGGLVWSASRKKCEVDFFLF